MIHCRHELTVPQKNDHRFGDAADIAKANFVLPNERIATFDKDGTLGCEQLVISGLRSHSPNALYPDALLAHLLKATYPLEVIEAPRWADENKSHA